MTENSQVTSDLSDFRLRLEFNMRRHECLMSKMNQRSDNLHQSVGDVSKIAVSNFEIGSRHFYRNALELGMRRGPRRV
jgi:hypothetical protein